MDYDDFEDLVDLEEALVIEEKENQALVASQQQKEFLEQPKIEEQPITPKELNPRKREPSPSIENEIIKRVKRCDDPVKYLHEEVPKDGEFVTFRNEVGKKFYISLYDSSSVAVDLTFKFVPSANFFETIDLAIARLASKESFRELASHHETFDENGALWLNKYHPKSYLDLLSDETTNRLLLRWIKAWDYYVFNRKPKKAKEPNNANPAIPQRRYGINENLVEEIDETDKRPRYKLVLIHGPPGLGKTTLAHLLAKVAGYNVVEMNASDDRNPAALKDKLEAVLNTSTSLKNCSRDGYKPSCLIIDEIDGAAGASIDLLIEAARTPLNAGKKSKSAKLAIRRPVICICNDLYAKTMRSFRGQNVPCFVIKCPLPSMNRITDRLLEIVDAEVQSQRTKKAIDKTLVHNLIDICERDVRSCVNALQYICSQKIEEHGDTRDIDLEAILKVSGTYKDKNSSLYGTWQRIFTLPIHGNKKEAENLSKRVSEVVEMFYSVGEPNLFISGIFENYLYARAKDAGMIVASEASKMIENYDRLFTLVNTMQDYSFMKYTSIVPAWFNLSLATYNGIVRQKSFDKYSSEKGGFSKYKSQMNAGLKWPTSELEASTKENRVIQTIENCLTNQWAHNGSRIERSDSIRMLSKRDFVLDTAPSLVDMIAIKTKRLRPVNSQLYSRQEKENLSEIIDLMLGLGLSWKLQSNSDSESNELTYQLTPPINDAVEFPTFCTMENRGSFDEISGAVQKLICHEMDLEMMRRSEKGDHNSNATPERPRFDLVVVKNPELLGEKGLSDAPKPKPKRDFFGRIIEKKPEKKNEPVDKDHMTPLQKWDLINRDVWFKFKEGYSNAVRLPVSKKRLEL